MNAPSAQCVRIMPDRLLEFTEAAFSKLGMPGEDAQLLSGLLVASDLRGVHSHGTRATGYYLNQFREGRLNICPKTTIVSETDTTVTLDGDGGLGYFPAHRAAHLVAGKAKERGVAVAVTRNHGHIGAAGHYSRIVSAADCIGICTSAEWSGRVLGRSVRHAGGGSPISIAVPTGDEPPLVPDMGLDFYMPDDEFADLFGRFPGAFIKFLGLSSGCHALAGVLTGVHAERPATTSRFAGATQGACLIAIDIERFLPIDEFKRQMDAYVVAAQKTRPFPGYERAELAGGPEARRERDYSVSGIPLAPRHQAVLDKVARELGITGPATVAT